MNIQELKSQAYDLVLKIEQLNYAYQQQLQPLQTELQALNKQINELNQPKPEEVEDKK